MKVTGLDQVAKVKVDMEGANNAYKQVPISASDGSPTHSLRVFTIEPGGHTPYHQHPFEHLNYAIAGQGVLVAEGGKEIPIKTGDFALVLPDEMHQYRNILDDQPLVMICAVPKEYE